MQPAPMVSPPAPQSRETNRPLRQVAEDLEATFLTEMLKPMGAGATRETFGGGAGEELFTSFLVEQEAKAMAHKGGIGLAEAIYRSLIASAGAENGQ